MQKDKTQITRLFLFFKRVYFLKEPEVNCYIARPPNRIFPLSRLASDRRLGSILEWHFALGVLEQRLGGRPTRDCLGQRTHLRGLGSLSTDSGLSAERCR